MKKITKYAAFLFVSVLLLIPTCVIAIEPVDLNRIVITASRIEQYDYKTTSGVTVISKKDIEGSGVQTIPEILETELGINLYDNSTAKTTTADIRGFGSTAGRNVLVLVNNRKINPIDISGPDLIQIPLEAVERIEVIRGAGSVLYGDNAVGGVINIITKQGKGKLSAKVGTSYGSYDATGTDLELSGEWKDLSYYIYSKYNDLKGYRQNSDVLTKDLNLRAGYKPSEKLKIDFSTNWHEDDYGQPGGLTLAEIDQRGRRGSTNENDYANTKDRSMQLSFDVTPWPEDIDLGKLALDISYRNRDTYSAFPSSGNWNTKSEIDTFGLNGKYIFDETILGQEMDLVIGFDFYDTDNDILGSGINSDIIGISKKEFGSYLFTEFELLDSLFINGGTRYQTADYIFDQKSGTPSYTKKEPSLQVSMGGLKYEYGKGSNIFLNIQQTFRFLATDEWYSTWSGLNTNLEKQTGLQYEIGLKHNFNDTIDVGVTPYWMDIKDEIYYNPSTFSNTNYAKTRRIGVEGEINVDLVKLLDLGNLNKLEFFTNYTYQDPKFNGGANDKKRIPMAPQHQVNSGVRIGFWNNFNLSLTGKYVGSSFAINDLANTNPKIKPYYVLDAKLSYENDNLELYTNINNINDEQYSTYAVKGSTQTDYFPAPETNFTIGAKYKF